MTYLELKTSVEEIVKKCADENNLSFAAIISDDTSVNVTVKPSTNDSLCDNLLATAAATYVKQYEDDPNTVGKVRFIFRCVGRLWRHIKSAEKRIVKYGE